MKHDLTENKRGSTEMLQRFNKKRDEGKTIEKEGRSQIKRENEMKNNRDASTQSLYPDLCFVCFCFFFFTLDVCFWIAPYFVFLIINYNLN